MKSGGWIRMFEIKVLDLEHDGQALNIAEKGIWQLRLNKAIRINRLRSAG